MYAQTNSSPYDNSYDFINQNYPSGISPMLVQSLTSDFDSINEAFMLASVNGNTSTGSGCTSSSYMGSPSSPLSCTSSHPPNTTAALMQRSLSSHSLQKNGFYLPVTSPAVFHDVEMGPVRRVFSTGDLDQGVKTLHHHPVGSPLANETTNIILEGMSKASRYSQWNQMAGEEDEEDEGQWIHLLNSLSSNLVP